MSHNVSDLNAGVIVDRDVMSGAIGGDTLNNPPKIPNTDPLSHKLM
jgi:hypothetical protein